MNSPNAGRRRRIDALIRRLAVSPLQLKLWLGIGVSLLIGLTILQVDHYRVARADAMEAVLVKARTLRAVLMASGRVSHQTLLDSGLPITAETIDLLPVHALARVSDEIGQHREADLRFKVVSLEQRDQAEISDVPDAEAIAYFERNPGARERLVEVTDPDGRHFYHYAQPILTEAYCLACHGDPKSLPESLRGRYAPAFGYREGDLRGVMSLWLPTDEIERHTSEHFQRSLFGHAMVFLGLFVVGALSLQRLVIGRLRLLQAATLALGNGRYQVRVPMMGQDELGDLANTFNRMADSIGLRDQQLARSEARLRLFIEHAPAALAMFDREMRYLAASRRWVTSYGLADGDLLGRRHYDLFPDLPEHWKQAHQRGLDGEVVEVNEDRFERSDGCLSWEHWAVHPWHEPDGRVGGIVIFTEDITERKAAEDALRQANEHNRALLEASLDPLVVIDRAGLISDVNRATEQATGYGREQLIGTDFSGYFSDPERARGGYRTAFVRGEVRDFELELLHRDGGATPVLYNASVYRGHKGAVEQVFAAARDITELKRAMEMRKARLRLLDGFEARSLEEILRASIDEAEALTGSSIGFYHFLEPDQETLRLQTWSTRTLSEFCQAEGAGLHYPLSEAGIWADCVRQRRAIIHNDYASLPARRGIPEGHAEVIRELVVPVFRDDAIVAVLGVGNKARDYDAADLLAVTTFADLAWDIVERKRTLNALRESEIRYRRFVETANEGIWAMDAGHLTTFVNARMARMLGYEVEEIMGRPVEDFMFEEDLAAHQDRMQARHRGQDEEYERRFRRKDGSEVWTLVAAVALYDETRGFEGSFAMFTDISQLKEQQLRLKQLAHFDPLTGLPNRVLLNDRLRMALARARREERLLAVCYLDLDGFKPVNDTHGHAAGDRLLVTIAARLSESVREQDTVARLGGDEFVLLLGNLASPEECAQILDRLLATIAEPHAIEPGVLVEVSASIGVTLYPPDRVMPEADTLLRHADLAMYEAKQAGGRCFRFFEPPVVQ